MADNKQYITHIQDGGSILISEDVIAAIVAQAVKEVGGVVGLSTRAISDLEYLIGKKNWNKGMRITINNGNCVAIECDVVVAYGHSVVEVAEQVQAAVVSAVQSTASVKKVIVNVNVCGIMRQ